MRRAVSPAPGLAIISRLAMFTAANATPPIRDAFVSLIVLVMIILSMLQIHCFFAHLFQAPRMLRRTLQDPDHLLFWRYQVFSGGSANGREKPSCPHVSRGHGSTRTKFSVVRL